DGERHEGNARGPDYEIQREGRDRSGPARGDWRLDEDGPDRIEGWDEVSFLVEGPARGGAPRRRRGPCGHHDLDGRRYPRGPDSTRGRTVQGVCDRKAPTPVRNVHPPLSTEDSARRSSRSGPASGFVA